ncbi:MAG: alpha/beta hydrolase family protein [Streptosporangiales bacterium]
MSAGGRGEPVDFRVQTPAGPAAVTLDGLAEPAGLLVLGHGAGGGVDARDLVAVRDDALTAGYAVARVTQPYRLAGRRAPAPARQLDAAFVAVTAALGDHDRLRGLPVVTGGRSSGARVACRTAAVTGARGVLALSFPLHPPGRPERSRADELRTVAVPTLVIQGGRDPFGGPDEVAQGLPAHIRIHAVPGADHGLKARNGDPPPLPDVATTVASWLSELAPRPATP